MPVPLYSLDPSERASGSRQDWTVGEKWTSERCGEVARASHPRSGVNDVHFGFVFIMFASVHFFCLVYVFRFEGD